MYIELKSCKCFNKKHEKLGILVNQYLRHNLGTKKYKLFDVTKFILVIPKFQLNYLRTQAIKRQGNYCQIYLQKYKTSRF